MEGTPERRFASGAELLRSRVGRRLVALFVLCALLPTAALAMVVFAHTSDQLLEQTRDRLHESTKAIGLAVHERLSVLERRLRQGLPGLAAGHADTQSQLEQDFAALRLLGPEGVTPLLGEADTPPEADQAGRRRLAEGRSLLQIEAGEDQDGGARLWLSVPDDAGRVYQARLRKTDLSQIADIYAEGSELGYCIFAGRHQVACSRGAPEALPAAWLGRSDRSGPHFEWEAEGRTQLGHQWSLFLEPGFGSASWAIVASGDRSAALAPLGDFRLLFGLILAGALALVVFLSFGQIRRSLIPLRLLLNGTRRVAAGDFGVRVELSSGDEFGELGSAFDGMAERLGRQFSTLHVIDQIDRAIFASLESEDVVRVVLTRIHEIHRCQAACLLLFSKGEGKESQRWVTRPGTPELRSEQIALDPSALGQLEPGSRRVRSGQAVPSYLDGLVADEVGETLELPLCCDDEVVGALALVHGAGAASSDPVYAQQIADQAAVAFSHIRKVEEIRELNRGLEERVRERTAELSQALSDLHETQGQLVHQEKMVSLGQLVAGVAHEINNPMNFVNGNLHFLSDYFESLSGAATELEALLRESGAAPDRIAAIREKHELDDALADLPSAFDGCREGVDRTMRIVESLRTFSQLDRSETLSVDLNEALESTLEILRGRFAELEVERDLAPLPAVRCMAGQINQVLMNLLTNAGDAVEAGGKIVLRTRAVDSDWVSIEVEDNGCGMAPDVKSRVFDPFFTTKEVGRGTGLGLSISYSVVERHGGHLEVESEEGQGSLFRIRLPVDLKEPGD